MAKLSGREIQKLAKQIITDQPDGIRYSELGRRIVERSPETPENTIYGSIYSLQDIFPNEITKPARGLFKSITASENESVIVGNPEQTTPSGLKIKEVDFYEPFADWLKM